ncbi:sugar ABC transporter substrate-binding protein [Candidatus Atribacteria bacterium 1244-E10-H5-B2]|nr:MAG: sugar ABC transporter substrate-binding protein [Candidatus Atribacteria bacterium 1244-E10-H5-B2]
MKKGLLIILIVALLVTISSFGVFAEELPKEIVIGWTPPDITGVFRTATHYFEVGAFDAVLNGITVSIIYRAPASHIAFGDQVAIIEDFITMGVDAIAISPIEVEVIIPAIRKANEAGIPVIIVNLLEPIAGVEVVSYIGFDNFECAEVSAYTVLDYFGGPGVLGTGRKVTVEPGEYLDLKWWRDLYATVTTEEKAAIKATGTIIEGVAGGFFSTARVNGFHSVIDEYPGIEIVGMLAADWNREKGIKAAEDFLTANPKGTLDFMWAASNEMGMGAMLAAEAVGRQDEVAIFTNDVTPESVMLIAEGRMVAETTHGFADWGWYGVEYAVRAALGLDVPPIFDIRPRTMYQENADEFFPDPKLEPIDWEAIKAEYLAK